VLELMATNSQPHPEDGWLAQVEAAVLSAVRTWPAVSVEATGAWTSDWKLATDLKAAGQRVVCVWIFAPLEVTLRRLAARSAPRAPVTEDEARSIWTAACRRAERHDFDLVLDTSRLRPDDLPSALAPLTTMLSG
jgi:hypothetical protein